MWGDGHGKIHFDKPPSGGSESGSRDDQKRSADQVSGLHTQKSQIARRSMQRNPQSGKQHR